MLLRHVARQVTGLAPHDALLGLAAQRLDIEAFGAREGFSIKSWHQDIQTGAGKDALLLRPGLAAALKEARVARDTIVSIRGKPQVPLSDRV
jgi:hypothetical protein